MSKPTNLDELNYQWPPNLIQYEAKIFLGLTTVEAMLSGVTFVILVGSTQSILGVFIALAAVAILLGFIKKIEKLGDRALIIHFITKMYETRQERELELPIIVGGDSAHIELEGWEDEDNISISLDK